MSNPTQTTDILIQEGLAAQLYKIANPHGPLWHVLREELRRRWRNKADDHLRAMPKCTGQKPTSATLSEKR